jgi:hypothetical protein
MNTISLFSFRSQRTARFLKETYITSSLTSASSASSILNFEARITENPSSVKFLSNSLTGNFQNYD